MLTNLLLRKLQKSTKSPMKLSLAFRPASVSSNSPQSTLEITFGLFNRDINSEIAERADFEIGSTSM